MPFASAHPARIASRERLRTRKRSDFASAHPTRITSGKTGAVIIDIPLCLSTSHTDYISKIAQMQCHKSTQYAVSW